jgi:tRNA-dihydrouridine synthase
VIRAAIGYPWFWRNQTLLKTGEHLAKPTVIDRVEAVRNHHLGNEWKGERLGIVETRPHYTNYFKGIHSLKPTSKISYVRSSWRVVRRFEWNCNLRRIRRNR